MLQFSSICLICYYRSRLLIFAVLCNLVLTSNAQKTVSPVINSENGLRLSGMNFSDSTAIRLSSGRPVFSLLINGNPQSSDNAAVIRNRNEYIQVLNNGVKSYYQVSSTGSSGWRAELIIENTGNDTVSISNIVPFGEDRTNVYITGYGPPGLARACLFRPGYEPLRVILPDNAWEMGYSSFSAADDQSVCALARRGKTEGGLKRRYETLLPPGSKVWYTIQTDLFTGDWQQGLRSMFRDKYLYDLESFDKTLYERSDLAWIRESYIIILQMAWDREFYDRFTGKYTFPEVIRKGVALFGKIDAYGIWPTWPRLGLDQRNQWDLYRDLPGGTAQLRNYARMSRLSGTRFFIAYNPWDNSTRKEDHYKGMAKLIREIEADGVVLDTRGNSSFELQAAADTVREGVVMYSEGMAVTADMPGIISGRVHNAIYLSPELNLNKLIKPDFAIFRVCDVGEDIIHREIAVSFFNGYGTELNMFRPGGRNEHYEQDLDFLSRTTFILRQNNDAFLDNDWTPLVQTEKDKIYVNRWTSGEKTLYTVLNMDHRGFSGRLFPVGNDNSDKHFVSLWHHEEIEPVIYKGKTFLSSVADGWNQSLSGTRREGSVDCIAILPDILKPELRGDSISVKMPSPGIIMIWKGNPSYKTEFRELLVKADTVIRIRDLFAYYEGKIVIQLVEKSRLIDEHILRINGGKPWLVSKTIRTERSMVVPADMVLVPGADISYKVTAGEDFIPYPESGGGIVTVDSFLIDKYPVTNSQYFQFIISSGYIPADTSRYLKNWQSGMYRQGQDKYPVVYISYEDAQAYARWAGKRLPTQNEWQFAAQGTDGRLWPWGNEFHGTYCNNSFDRPTPVDAFSKGQSKYGVVDLVGNVWQLTNDIYFNGTNYFGIIRGGSYYNPESSWWYIKGGPQPLDRTQIMLMVSPGFDRSATVGFRCVKDVVTGSIKGR